MRFYRFFAAMTLVVAVCFAVSVSAKDRKVKTMYVFGIATSCNDSTAYFTPIQAIDSVETFGKTKLLANKQEYSYQLRNFFERKGIQHETCITVNSTNKAKLEKSMLKLKQKYAKKWNLSIQNIDGGEFTFERVVMAQ